MTKRRALFVGLLVALGLVLLAAKPVPHLKARAQRFQAVNNFALPFPQSTFVLTNGVVTNWPSGEAAIKR